MATLRNFSSAEPLHPIPVHCAGFQSDTLTLQRFGWEFFVEYKAAYLAFQMILLQRTETETWSVSMLVNDMPVERLQYPGFSFEFMPPSRDIHIIQKAETLSLTQVDMELACINERQSHLSVRHYINDAFPPPIQPEKQEIIVPTEQDVDTLLKSILNQQLPVQAELRKRTVDKRQEPMKQEASIVVPFRAA